MLVPLAGPLRTLACARPPPRAARATTAAPGELQLVLDNEYLDSQRLEREAEPDELQLVLDPEFL